MRWLVLGDIGRKDLYHVGDEAMVEVAIAELSVRGASALTLVATHAETAARRYGVPAIDRIGVGPRWSTPKRDHMLECAEVGEFEGFPTLARLDEEVQRADAVLISGGGNMASRFGHHIDERAALVRLAKRHGKPVVVAAQTVGPILSERERRLVAEMIDAARAFAVRDDESYRLALDLGGEPERVHRISDDAILLSPRQQDFAAAAAAVGHNDRYVVASFTADAGNSGLDRHEYLDAIAAALDEIAGTLDVDVLLVPHIGALDGAVMVGDELSDASILERATSGRVRMLPAMTARVSMAVTVGAVVSLSTRYHPLIFATAHSIPALGISLSTYSTVRMRGALEPLGLDQFVVGPASLAASPTAVRDAAENGAAIKAWLEPLIRARRDHQRAWWDSAVPTGARSLPPAPVARARFPIHGDWAGPATRALELFSKLEEERERSTGLQAALDGARRGARDQGAALAAARRRVNALTSRAERAEGRRMVRVADRIGTLARAAVPRSSDPPAANPRTPGPQPLLSVLIPIYNVETYLHECLESVVSQSLKDMEIILIDDGSTDSSPEIAQDFASRDSRIRYIVQDNRGLGAVRNRGVRLARGRYLTFVDSDDVVPRSAFAALVDALESSGSDVGIGGTVRLHADGSRRTWQWVRDQHARNYRTTLAQTPQLLRNFYTWNKAYRADFWRQHDFRFREGVLFEDQPAITEILHRADSVEVLAQNTYHYRIRSDDSALTGKMYALPDIRTRHEATRLTAQALKNLNATPRVRRAWLWTLAEHHLPRYLKETVDKEAEYAAVVEMMRDFLTPKKLDEIEEISAAHRLLCYLALTEKREIVAEYLQAGGGSASAAALERHDGRTVAMLSQPGVDVDFPDWAGDISPAEQRLAAIFDGHRWQTPTVLTVDVRVGISQALPPRRLDVTVAAVFADGEEVSLQQEGELHPITEHPRPLGVSAWYATQVMIDVGALHREYPRATAGGVRIEVEVNWDGLSRRGVLDRRGAGNEARHLTGSMLPGEPQAVQLGWSRPSGLELKFPLRAVFAEMELGGTNRVKLSLQSRTPDFDIVFLEARAEGAPARRQMVRRTGTGEYVVTVDLGWLSEDSHVHFVAVDEYGARRNVHVPAPPDAAASEEELVASTTAGARLRITRLGEKGAVAER